MSGDRFRARARVPGLWILIGLAALAVVLPASGALASARPTTAVLLQIDGSADNGAETGQYAAFFPVDTVISGQFNWSPDDPVTILSTQHGIEIGTFDSLNLVLNADPGVALNFSVVAGTYGSTFTISSALITFEPLVNPSAYATAQVTVTDNNLNGVTLAGLFPGGKAYQARTGNPAVGWASLLGTVTAPAGSSGGVSGRHPAPPPIWEALPGPVDIMSSQFKFQLTAGDSASGTSWFELVPEPGSLSLVALAGLALLRRPRR